MRKRIVALLILCLVWLMKGHAQDPRFSQPYATPLWFNAGMTAMYDGNYRLTTIYRSQWSSVLRNNTSPFGQIGTPMFRTFGASVDFKANKGLAPGDGFGGGLLMLADKAGELDYGIVQAGLRMSYNKSLNRYGTNILAIGIGADMMRLSINTLATRFGDQYDPDNPTIPAGTNDPLILMGYLNSNKTMIKANAGVFWFMRIKKNKRFNVWAGAAFDNIASPDISLVNGYTFNQPFALPMRITGHTGIQFPISNRLDLMPSTIFMMQDPHMEMQFGTDLKVLFEPRYPMGNAIHFGAHLRMVGGDAAIGDGPINMESVIFKVRIDYYTFNIHAAYDLNISDLAIASDTRGAIEFGITYYGKIKTRYKDVLNCPRF